MRSRSSTCWISRSASNCMRTRWARAVRGGDDPREERAEPGRARAEGGNMAQHAIEPVEEDGHDAVAQRGLGRGVEFPACEDGVGIVARGGEIWRGRRGFEGGAG